MTILDGKACAAQLRGEMAVEVQEAVAKGIRPPGLAVIMAGNDPASEIYVRNKRNACEQTGIISMPFFLREDATQAELLDLIASLNDQPAVDGILLQLPLPAGLDASVCLEAINPEKDVDGFHPVNVGRLMSGLDGFRPCTPAGMIELLKYNGYSLAGKRAVVVGRSNIVGKPLASMLSAKEHNATVTLCHTGTENLAEETRRAEFLFLACGSPHMITGDMVSTGCVVVDAGITRGPNGFAGDADFDSVSRKAAAITPVPGGVGPMTIAMLLRNTLDSWRKRIASLPES